MGVKDTEVDSKNDKQKKKAINIGYFSYIKIILVLGLVILAIYVIYQFMRKFLKIKGDIGEESAVIVNQAVGPGKWVQVVYIAGKYLVLGISNEQVSLLTEIVDKKEIEHLEILLNEKRSQEGENFIDIISDFFKNTLKKTFNKEKFDYEEDSVDFLKEQKDRIDKMKKRN